jgi:hypothetical protein
LVIELRDATALIVNTKGLSGITGSGLITITGSSFHLLQVDAGGRASVQSSTLG